MRTVFHSHMRSRLHLSGSENLLQFRAGKIGNVGINICKLAAVIIFRNSE